MNIKDVIGDTTKDTLPAFKKEYYSSIYKKTEKVVCAVFAITDIPKEKDNITDVITDTRRVAKESLVCVVDFMSFGGARFEDVVRALLTLRSLLQVLSTLRAVRGELVDVVAREIDGVIKNLSLLQKETRGEGALDSNEQPVFVEAVTAHRKPSVFSSAVIARPRSSEGVVSSTTSVGRRERILDIMRTRGVVSIKDISDIITDCSEKTIQRDLMDMIKDNVIQKEGERRWSKYSLV